MILRRVAPLIVSSVIAACVPAAEAVEPAPQAQPSQAAIIPADAAPTPSPTARATNDLLVFDGELTQGGWIRGKLPPGEWTAQLGSETIEVERDGSFFAAFDRDSAGTIVFKAVDANLIEVTKAITVAPRDWQIERVNIARRPGGASDAFMKRRQPELDAIWNARLKETGAQGWRQDFIWPVKGRISGRFGSQRIYRGEPGSYHSGLDITTGTSGSPYVAPADGVVVLAVQGYSLEGNLLIIDHGNGLNSAFLHSSRLYVKEGDAVKKGQHVGDIGMSGRATGPHLHWSIKWKNARLDPLLFTGPMN
ncbi:MAG: M23 family metallopeptidase [Erythrobacter sp.]